MDTSGNATDFGDLTVARRAHSTHASSPTRTVFTGGQTPTAQNVMDFITIATTGNAADFGDLTSARGSMGACGTSVFGMTGGGSGNETVMDRFTIASQGNAADFGDMVLGRHGAAACSNSVRGLWGGGRVSLHTKMKWMSQQLIQVDKQ